MKFHLHGTQNAYAVWCYLHRSGWSTAAPATPNIAFESRMALFAELNWFYNDLCTMLYPYAFGWGNSCPTHHSPHIQHYMNRIYPFPMICSRCQSVSWNFEMMTECHAWNSLSNWVRRALDTIRRRCHREMKICVERWKFNSLSH